LPVGGCYQKFFGSGLRDVLTFLLPLSIYEQFYVLAPECFAVTIEFTSCHIHTVSLTLDNGRWNSELNRKCLCDGERRFLLRFGQ
jgi:hypothetical protein